VRPENVLLVDDNELLLAGMKRFFEKDFVHVAASSTGEEAIAIAQGIMGRVIAGTANDPNARLRGERARPMADAAWTVISGRAQPR